MNTYRLRATSLCPANDGRDHYDVEIQSEEMIRIEELREFFDDHANERIFQEDLLERTRERFPNADVVISGDHPPVVQVVSR